MSNKTRLDILLTERGLAESRQKAQAVIMAGHVFVAGQRVDKPGTAVLSDAPIEVRGHTCAASPATTPLKSAIVRCWSPPRRDRSSIPSATT